ncbi:hypothetical protein CRENBAI_004459 [Crenichthys baileyi]|uniref:Uncharacterized protein n=1 Tax=Crenichthys baileyi TaxID=28760 RepID=A0AAV9RKT4_9TELE
MEGETAGGPGNAAGGASEETGLPRGRLKEKCRNFLMRFPNLPRAEKKRKKMSQVARRALLRAFYTVAEALDLITMDCGSAVCAEDSSSEDEEFIYPGKVNDELDYAVLPLERPDTHHPDIPQPDTHHPDIPQPDTHHPDIPQPDRPPDLLPGSKPLRALPGSKLDARPKSPPRFSLHHRPPRTSLRGFFWPRLQAP